jgi:hypothetical protein
MNSVKAAVTSHTPPVFDKTEDGGLLIKLAKGTQQRVVVRPCFPWTHPTEYLSVRDSKGNELAVIDHLADLSESSREAVTEALREARFTFQITAILEIEKDFELRTWKVNTEQGNRRFQTKFGDWPHTLPEGGVVIRDLSGDLYHIPDPEQLDKHSAKILWAFLG